jgi:hypothetical protein
MGTGGTPSVEGGEAPSAAPEPKKKGRFKIIEEENPSRAPSKVPSSANLAAEARGRSLGSAAAVLPELLRLHEQSVNHANSLARVIDSVRASCSGGSLAAAEELTAPLAAAAGGIAAAGAGALPPRKPAAGAAGGGLLSRVGSSRVLQVGHEGRGVTLQQLLTESNGDSMDVAEKLYERVQVRERELRGTFMRLGAGQGVETGKAFTWVADDQLRAPGTVEVVVLLSGFPVCVVQHPVCFVQQSQLVVAAGCYGSGWVLGSSHSSA